MPDYSNPPVVEAVVEIRFVPTIAAELGEIAHFIERNAALATMERHNLRQAQFQVGPVGAGGNVDVENVGFSLRDGIGGRVIHLLANRFLYSKLAPYEVWDDWKGHAEQLWIEFQSIARPVSFQRAGMRYINHIVVPKETFELEEYLSLVPVWNEHLAEVIDFCETSIGFELPSNSGRAKVTMRPNQQTLLLDIDVWRDQTLPADPLAIFAILEDLKIEERRVFEDCITDEARKLFV